MSVEYVFHTAMEAGTMSEMLGLSLTTRGPNLADGQLGGHYLWVLTRHGADAAVTHSVRRWGVPLPTQVWVQLVKDAPDATRAVVERIAVALLATPGDVVLTRADEGAIFTRLGGRLTLNTDASWWKAGVPSGFPADYEWASIPEF